MGIAQELPHACAVQSGKSRQLPWCRGTQPPMRTCDGVSSNPNCPRTDVETTEGRAAKCGTQLCHCNVSGGKILRLFGHRLAGVDWLAARCAHSVIWHGWHPRGRAIVSYLTPARGPSFVQPCQWSRYAAATLRAGRQLSPRTPSAYARRACLCHSCHRPRAPALCHAPPTNQPRHRHQLHAHRAACSAVGSSWGLTPILVLPCAGALTWPSPGMPSTHAAPWCGWWRRRRASSCTSWSGTPTM